MIYTRKNLEEIEDNSLASYGIRSKDTKGREYPDREPDYRTSFQRDRDRALPRAGTMGPGRLLSARNGIQHVIALPAACDDFLAPGNGSARI